MLQEILHIQPLHFPQILRSDTSEFGSDKTHYVKVSGFTIKTGHSVLFDCPAFISIPDHPAIPLRSECNFITESGHFFVSILPLTIDRKISLWPVKGHVYYFYPLFDVCDTVTHDV
ncbi:TPA: hypothetical protein R4229_004003 [Morganella morganii]|nr:hypothetical protein [Morganella morganii]